MGGVFRLRLRRLARSLDPNSSSSKTLIITRPSHHRRLPLLRGGPIPALALPALFTRIVGVQTTRIEHDGTRHSPPS